MSVQAFAKATIKTGVKMTFLAVAFGFASYGICRNYDRITKFFITDRSNISQSAIEKGYGREVHVCGQLAWTIQKNRCFDALDKFIYYQGPKEPTNPPRQMTDADLTPAFK